MNRGELGHTETYGEVAPDLLKRCCNHKLLWQVLLAGCLVGCKPPEIRLSGSAFVVTTAGVNVKLGDVEIQVVEAAKAKDLFKRSQDTVRSQLAALKQELATAQDTLKEAQRVSQDLAVSTQYQTNAEYIQLTDDRDRLAKQLDVLMPGREKWASQNARFAGAANVAVGKIEAGSGDWLYIERQTLVSNLRLEISVLETRAKQVFDPKGPPAVDAPALNIPLSSSDEIPELKAWRRFLDQAEAGIRMIMSKTSAKRQELAVLDERLTELRSGKYKLALSQADAASSKVAAAKKQLEGFPALATLFALFTPSAKASTRTDSEGAFTLTYPRKGDFLIYARAQRTTLDSVERYYWMVAAPKAEKVEKLILSNHNMISIEPDGSLHPPTE
jgi:hypothetical protein